MLKDVFAYLGLSSFTGGGHDASPTESLTSSSHQRVEPTEPPRIGLLPAAVLRDIHDLRVDGNTLRVVIRGDRRVGKSALLSRMEHGLKQLLSETYTPTNSIRAGAILWKPLPRYAATSPSTEGLQQPRSTPGVKACGGYPPPTIVELWDVVDKGTSTSLGFSSSEKHVLTSAITASLALASDASTIDVYKKCHGAIFVVDVTRSETFEYVRREAKKVPSHVPVAVCLNFMDLLAGGDADRRQEVSERDVQEWLAASVPHATSKFVRSVLLTTPGGAASASSLLGGGFGVPPVVIGMSTKTGYGLKPLHCFIGSCVAFAKTMEMETALDVSYQKLRAMVHTTVDINAEQDYTEFLNWIEEQEQGRLAPRSSARLSGNTAAHTCEDSAAREELQRQCRADDSNCRRKHRKQKRQKTSHRDDAAQHAAQTSRRATYSSQSSSDADETAPSVPSAGCHTGRHDEEGRSGGSVVGLKHPPQQPTSPPSGAGAADILVSPLAANRIDDAFFGDCSRASDEEDERYGNAAANRSNKERPVQAQRTLLHTRHSEGISDRRRNVLQKLAAMSCHASDVTQDPAQSDSAPAPLASRVSSGSSATVLLTPEEVLRMAEVMRTQLETVSSLGDVAPNGSHNEEE